jgi:hypothetical protein
VVEDRNEPPYEGGSQPVPEHPPEVSHGGRTAMQTVVIVIGALVLLAAILWILIPLLGT